MQEFGVKKNTLFVAAMAAAGYAALVAGSQAQDQSQSGDTAPRPTQAQPARPLPTINVTGRQQRARTRPAAAPARPAAAPPPAQAQPVAAPLQGGIGPVVGYTAKDSVTATKTDTPVLETPQSISIVPKDQIQDQGAQSVVQALRYTPSVTLDAFSSNSFFDSIKLRGFTPPQYLDGLRLPLDPGTQFAFPRIEPYGLERIEVLKGPSSGLYGQTDPGGLINMVSKRPQAVPHAEIEGVFGSFDRIQGMFDIGGPADKDGQYLFRFVGLARDANSQLDYQTDNKLFFAPSFTWRPTTDTSLTILAQTQHIDNKGYQQYVPGIGSLVPNPNGQIPYSRYIGEPSIDGYKLDQTAIGYAFEHRFNETFLFRSNSRYMEVSNNLTGVRTEGLLPDLRTSLRSVNYVMSDTRNFTTDNSLQADFATGPLKHKVLLGVDYMDMKSHSDYRFAFVDPIDVFNPVYGAPMPPANSLAPFILRDDTLKQTGVYLQDQVKLDRWMLTLTGRHDWSTTVSNSMGQFPPPGVAAADDTAFTGRVGLAYMFDFGLVPYANYSTSFVPVVGADAAGNAFKPTTGEGKEIGVKYQAPGTNLLMTAAVFETTQQNVLAAILRTSAATSRSAKPACAAWNSKSAAISRASSRSSAATATSIRASPRAIPARSASIFRTPRWSRRHCGAYTLGTTARSPGSASAPASATSAKAIPTLPGAARSDLHRPLHAVRRDAQIRL